MKRLLTLSLVLAVILASFGCGGGSTTPKVKNPPTISSFSASPTTIHRGESSTLSWTVSGATSLTIDQGVGTVTGTTSKSVSPTNTTTYTLTATNADGTKTSTCTVTIELVLPTINSFALSPTTITRGGTSTLTWNVSGATSATIDQGIGTVSATSGTQTVNPTATTTYTLTATNSDGNKTATCTLNVDKLYPTINHFTSNPTSIRKDLDLSTLSWSVQNADTVVIDQGVGSVPATGSTQVSPQTTTIYTLTATNIDGSRTATCQVDILKSAILAITTNPTTPYGIYNAYYNQSTFNFFATMTESNGVGGLVSHFMVGTYTSADVLLGAWDFGSGIFNPFGTITATCVFTSPGRPDSMIIAVDCVDNNGYPWIVSALYTFVLTSAEGPTAQFVRMLEPNSRDPRVTALEQSAKRTKR